MLFFKKRILGVDFGTRSVKIVELEKSGQKFNLINYSITDLLWEDSINYPLGTTQLREEDLASILRESTKGFKTKDIVFVLPASFLFSKFFSLPNLPKKALKSTIAYEMKKYFPSDSEEITVHSRIFQINNQYQQDKAKSSVFLVGVPNGLTAKLKIVSDIAGLNYKKGETEFFAFEPFFNESVGDAILINVDLNYSLLLFFHGGKFVFGKKLKFKFYNLMENVSKLIDGSLEKAEKFLSEKKFNFENDSQGICDSADAHFNSACEEIQTEINEISDKFGFKIENIFLSGDLIEMPGFFDIFQRNCGKLKINLLNSFSKLQNVPNKSNVINKSPIFGGAIGACIRYF